MTAYRYNTVGQKLSVSIVEGETVSLPTEVEDKISEVTNPTWPESYWAPYGMTSFEYMSAMGPNHDANSFGLIGADLITINAMLRIPVDFHNIADEEIFRPSMWDRFGGDDFRACEHLGPVYACWLRSLRRSGPSDFDRLSPRAAKSQLDRSCVVPRPNRVPRPNWVPRPSRRLLSSPNPSIQRASLLR